MVKEFSILYRDHIDDYVLNERGDLIYNPKTDRTFSDFDKALRYLIQNYGARKSQLFVDDHCRDNFGSELERKLDNTKIVLRQKIVSKDKRK